MVAAPVAVRHGRSGGSTPAVAVRTAYPAKQAAGAFESGLAARTQEAVGADLREAARQHVLQAAVQDRCDGQREVTGLVGAGIMGVTEGDVALRVARKARVGDPPQAD